LLSGELVFLGEIPPGWELEWVDDAESWHHGWSPVMFYRIASSISAVLKLLTFTYHVMNYGL
jgi:hypothetical protein